MDYFRYGLYETQHAAEIRSFFEHGRINELLLILRLVMVVDHRAIRMPAVKDNEIEKEFLVDPTDG